MINEYDDSYLPYWLFTQQQSEKELVNCYYFKYKCFNVWSVAGAFKMVHATPASQQKMAKNIVIQNTYM